MKKLSNKKLITFIFNVFLIVFYTNTVFGITVPSVVENTLTKITNILLLIGTAVCIGKIIHIGILFVMSSAVDKSTAKQAIMPWVIGVIVCFGAATVGGAIIELFMNSGVPNGVLDY